MFLQLHKIQAQVLEGFHNLRTEARGNMEELKETLKEILERLHVEPVQEDEPEPKMPGTVFNYVSKLNI